MSLSCSRRLFLRVSLGVPAAALPALAAAEPTVTNLYPTQPPEIVQEMVMVAHANLSRVKDLVARQPALAKAAWDWGFGDWETALGAASHMGNRAIAEVLLSNGAHPTIFSAAMLGQLDAVKGFIAARPGIQRTHGPHSITLLAHALAGGEGARPVVEYLKSIEGADDKPAVQPLADADVAKLTGIYAFGGLPSDRMEVTATKNQLQIGRPGHFPRGLFHLGSFEFCPMGAEHVRIRFAEQTGAMVMTVHDPDIVLTARKTA